MSAPTAGGTWYACHTRPRREKRFAGLMKAQGFEHYLPLLSSVRRYPSGTKRFTKPLFAGYVFALIPDAGKSRIYQQELLARAIPVDDEAAFLRQLQDVRAIVASGLELALVPLLARGRRVRVVGGPLHGLEGLVDDSSDPQGIVVSVDVLRQGLLLRVPADGLEPLP
ncbi:MAG TPA: transcription termination/antitermination NusG family protein [Opitutaceae bacterium]